MTKNIWFLNGGRGSGRTFRFLCETYKNKIAALQHKVDTLQGEADSVREEQLTRAIKIIKEMLSILPKENIEGIYEVTEIAEQFLREVDK